jgi:hypothetical protein
MKNKLLHFTKSELEAQENNIVRLMAFPSSSPYNSRKELAEIRLELRRRESDPIELKSAEELKELREFRGKNLLKSESLDSLRILREELDEIEVIIKRKLREEQHERENA